MLRSFMVRFRSLLNHPVYRQNRLQVFGRAVAWTFHCVLRIPARAKFKRWNYTLYLPAKWRGGGCTAPYVFREHYEPELLLLEQFLEPGMVFVDGGANTGVFSFTAARMVGPEGHVFTFEPGSTCFHALERSKKLNGFNQIHLAQQALSDHSGTARLYHHLGQENAFTLGVDENAPYDEVSIVSLDEVAKQQNLERVDFIKLDVEGAEELVLRGAQNVLKRWRPVVLFEINLDAARRMKLAPDGACELLHSLGYELFSFDDNHDLVAAGELPTQVANRFAIPSESPAMQLIGAGADRKAVGADIHDSPLSRKNVELEAVST
ncbi:MAG TPA: FkbM family methyltransferase [Pirellulales bacterium]